MLKYSRSASPSGYTHEGSAPIHPGWLAAFVVAALVGQVSAVALPGMQSESAFIASCAVLAVVVLGAYYLRTWVNNAIAEREEALRRAEILGDVARELNSTLDPGTVVAASPRRSVSACRRQARLIRSSSGRRCAGSPSSRGWRAAPGCR